MFSWKEKCFPKLFCQHGITFVFESFQCRISPQSADYAPVVICHALNIYALQGKVSLEEKEWDLKNAFNFKHINYTTYFMFLSFSKAKSNNFFGSVFAWKKHLLKLLANWKPTLLIRIFYWPKMLDYLSKVLNILYLAYNNSFQLYWLHKIRYTNQKGKIRYTKQTPSIRQILAQKSIINSNPRRQQPNHRIRKLKLNDFYSSSVAKNGLSKNFLYLLVWSSQVDLIPAVSFLVCSL